LRHSAASRVSIMATPVCEVSRFDSDKVTNKGEAKIIFWLVTGRPLKGLPTKWLWPTLFSYRLVVDWLTDRGLRLGRVKSSRREFWIRVSFHFTWTRKKGRRLCLCNLEVTSQGWLYNTPISKIGDIVDRTNEMTAEFRRTGASKSWRFLDDMYGLVHICEVLFRRPRLVKSQRNGLTLLN